MSTVTSTAGIRPSPLTLGQLAIRVTDDLPDLFVFILVFLPVLALLFIAQAIATVSPGLAMVICVVPVLYVLGRLFQSIWDTRHQQQASF